MAPLFTKLFLVMLTRLPILVCSRVVGWAPEEQSPVKTKSERKAEKLEQLEALARAEKAERAAACAKTGQPRKPCPHVDPEVRAKGEAAVEEARLRAEAARDELTKGQPKVEKAKL